MKRNKVWMFATLLALGGISVSTVGAPLLTVQAAEEATVAAKEYNTQAELPTWEAARQTLPSREMQARRW